MVRSEIVRRAGATRYHRSPASTPEEPCPLVKIQEADAKSLLVAQGLPVPGWEVAHTIPQARAAAERILAGGASAVVIKAQVLVGGRGKAGGVKLASDPDEAERIAGAILGMDIKGITVRKVLVAPAADIVSEYYLSAVLDRAARRILLMGSAEGGVEIEQVAVDHPEAIIRHHADPMLGLLDYQARAFAFEMGLGRPPQGRGRHRDRARPDDARLRRRPGRDQPARGRPRDGGRTAPSPSGSSASTPR